MGDKTWSPTDVLSAADLMKYGQNVHGSYSGTTDASNELVVTHGCGFTPSGVFIQYVSPNSGANQGMPMIVAVTSTTFTIHFLNINGSMATVAVTGYWTCVP